MTYIIAYSTASHDAVDGNYDSLDDAREAFAARWDYYRGRLGWIVEGTTDFPDDARHSEPLEDAESVLQWATRQHSDEDFVLCQSADGWSLHAPGSTDDQIADGTAPYLVAGDGEPSEDDYRDARITLLSA